MDKKATLIELLPGEMEVTKRLIETWLEEYGIKTSTGKDMLMVQRMKSVLRKIEDAQKETVS